MSRSRHFVLVIMVCAAMLFQACAPKTIQHKLAIYTANVYTAVSAITQAIAVLSAAGRISPARAKAVYLIEQKVVSSLDILRDRAEKGFEKRSALLILGEVLDDIKHLELEAVIELDPANVKKFREYIFFVQFTIISIQAVIDATRHVSVPTEEIERTMGVRVRVQDELVWIDLVLILQKAITTGLAQTRLDQAAAFTEGKTLSLKVRNDLTRLLGALP